MGNNESTPQAPTSPFDAQREFVTPASPSHHLAVVPLPRGNDPRAGERPRGPVRDVLTQPAEGARPLPAVNLQDPGQRTALILDPRCLLHATEVDKRSISSLSAGHEPERPLRVFRIYHRLEEEGLLNRVSLDISDLPPASALSAVHSAAHLERLRSLQQREGPQSSPAAALEVAQPCLLSQPALDAFLAGRTEEVAASRVAGGNRMVEAHPADNPHSEYTPLAAALSAGAVTRLVDFVAGGRAVNGMSVMRPPGHHCAPGGAAGFCYLANVAIGVKWARAAHGVRRIAVVDFDVHAGDGTESALADDPESLVLSLHRNDADFFPTGQPCGPSYVGANPAGKFVNIGWEGASTPHGMGDSEYAAAFVSTVLPLLSAFQPEMIFVSAGYDAADGDPLGGQHVSPPGYGVLVRMLAALDPPRGLVLVLEGGYNVDALSASVAESVRGLIEASGTSRRRVAQAGSSAVTAAAADPDAAFLRRAPETDAPAARDSAPGGLLTAPRAVRAMRFDSCTLGAAVHAVGLAAVRRTLRAHAPYWPTAAAVLATLAAIAERTAPVVDSTMRTYADLAQVEAGSRVVLFSEASAADGSAPLFARLPVPVLGAHEGLTGNVKEERDDAARVATRHTVKSTPPSAGRPAARTAIAWRAVSRSHSVSVEVQVREGGFMSAHLRVRDEAHRCLLDATLAPAGAAWGPPAALDKPSPDVLAQGLPGHLFKAKHALPVLLQVEGGETQAATLLLYAPTILNLPVRATGKTAYPAIFVVASPRGLVPVVADGPLRAASVNAPGVSAAHAHGWCAAWDAWAADCSRIELLGTAGDAATLPPLPDMTSDAAVPVTALAGVSFDKALMKRVAEAAARAVAMIAAVAGAGPPATVAPVAAQPAAAVAVEDEDLARLMGGLRAEGALGLEDLEVQPAGGSTVPAAGDVVVGSPLRASAFSPPAGAGAASPFAPPAVWAVLGSVAPPAETAAAAAVVRVPLTAPVSLSASALWAEVLLDVPSAQGAEVLLDVPKRTSAHLLLDVPSVPVSEKAGAPDSMPEGAAPKATGRRRAGGSGAASIASKAEDKGAPPGSPADAAKQRHRSGRLSSETDAAGPKS
jgi:acetoin utilization deacetylase AcuC-like enzyme